MSLSLISSDHMMLRTRAVPIGRVRAGARLTFDEMIDCMDVNCGIGLAAPQVGKMLRLIVMRAPQLICMADPVIIASSANFDTGEEGCLSFPDVRVHVRRHARVTVRYRDYHNEERQAEMHGVEATCVQHEIDHLDGVTFFARAYQDGMFFADGATDRSPKVRQSPIPENPQ